jgi:phenylacetate-CoA ligase
LFDQNGIKPSDIQSVADLSLIPITSKKDLQLLPPENVVARGVNPENLITHRTSGSSGEPLIIRRTWFEERLFGLLRLRMLRNYGLRFKDRQASVGLVREERYFHDRLSLKIPQAFGFLRKVRVNCLLPPNEIVRVLRNLHPDILSGFSGVLSHISQTINDEDLLSIHPKFVVVGAEVLTPLMRSQIAQAFRAPVFDYYASHEFGLIGWECKKTGEIHTCDDSIVLEILNNERAADPGDRGEVVGTSLHSFAMPFIRYRLGDIVTKGNETCPCGQPFSTIRAIQGRMLDYFPLPDGRAMHPYELIRIIVSDKYPWISQYQLTQEQKDRFILRVVPSINPTQQQLLQLEEAVNSLLGHGMEFQSILVPEIQLEPNGKFRVSRSLVKSAYDGINWDKFETERQNSFSRHDGEKS